MPAKSLCGEKKKGSFWRGVGALNLISTVSKILYHKIIVAFFNKFNSFI